MVSERHKKVLEILGSSERKYKVDVVLGKLYWFKKSSMEYIEMQPAAKVGGFVQYILSPGGVRIYGHELIWLAAHGLFKGKVRHNDGDRSNNVIGNLSLDVIDVEPKSKVIRHEEIEMIKKLMELYPNWSSSRIARELGLNINSVCRVIRKIKSGDELKYGVPGKRPVNL